MRKHLKLTIFAVVALVFCSVSAKAQESANMQPDNSQKTSTVRYKGFVGNTVGMGRMVTEFFHINNGVLIKDAYYVGIGIGGAISSDWDPFMGPLGMPIYLTGRWDAQKLMGKRWAPFAQLDLGYNAPGNHGGFYLQAMGGYRYKINRRCGIGAGIGYMNISKINAATITIAFDW